MIRRALLVVLITVASSLSLDAQQADAPAGSARIGGRVVAAETGAPLAGSRVVLEATRLLRTKLSSLNRTTSTDINGLFDFPGLPAGDYKVTVTKTGYLARTVGQAVNGGQPLTVTERQFLDKVSVPMTRGGAIFGRVFDSYGEPAARVAVQVRRYQYASDGTRVLVPAGVPDSTDDLGQYRVYGLPAGDFVVLAAGTASPTNLVTVIQADRADTAPTYFPGTASLGDAQVLSLAAGAESPADFTLIPTKLIRLTGTAVRSTGVPAAGMMVNLRATSGDSVTARTSSPVGADGTFSVANVAPGRYWLEIEGWRPELAGEGALVPLTVGSDDLAVSVVTSRGTTIRGRVTFDGVGRRPPSLLLRAVPTDAGLGMRRWLGDEARVGADGAFEVTGVLGHVMLVSQFDGWVVTSVIVDGDDKADDSIDPGDRGMLDDVRVTVSDRLSSVAGRIVDDRGRPLANHVAVLMRMEKTAVPRQRFRLMRTDGAGRFEAEGLRSGEWVAGAVETLEDGYHFSPEFQERLRVHGRRFMLTSGESVTLEMSPTSGLP